MGFIPEKRRRKGEKEEGRERVEDKKYDWQLQEGMSMSVLTL